MNFTFDFFEKILTGELNFIAPQLSTNTNVITTFLLENESNNIQKRIRKQVFDAKSQDEIRQIVQHNHRNIMSLSFRLLNSIENPNQLDKINFDSETYLQKLVFHQIENLLRFLEKEFREHLCSNSLIAYQSSFYDKNTTQNQMANLNKYFQKSRLSTTLSKAIFEPLTLLSSINLQNRISYQQLDYCLNYLDEWSKIIQNESEILTDEKIISILFILNQNSIESFDFITSSLRDKIEDLISTNEKTDFVRWELKLLKQMNVCYAFSFKEELPPLKTQIINWLEEEMNYWLEKSNITKSETIAPKVCTTLSVAELGLFLRLQYESGLLKTDNQRELVKFVASNFQTEKTKEISSKSLLSKYYTIETGSKKEVKQKLKMMLDLLNEW